MQRGIPVAFFQLGEGIMKKVEQDLIKAKLITPVTTKEAGPARFEVTELGRRFMDRYAKTHEKIPEK